VGRTDENARSGGIEFSEPTMFATFLVFLGGGIGASLRHGVNVLAGHWLGLNFSWGTIIVNVLGSFIIGLLIAWLAFRTGDPWSQPLRLFLATGILGGFTTFSAFSLDFAILFERGEILLAVTYVVASVVLSLAAVFAGFYLVRSLG
jgi:fluoride exporter